MVWGRAVLNGDCRMLAVDTAFHTVFVRAPSSDLLGASFPRLFQADSHDTLVHGLSGLLAGNQARLAGEFTALAPSGAALPVVVVARNLPWSGSGSALIVLVRCYSGHAIPITGRSTA